MKAGRPAYHIRAKWITLMGPQGSLVYYELDSKGNLVNKKQDIQPTQLMEANQGSKNRIPLAETSSKTESPCLELKKTKETEEENKKDNASIDAENDFAQDFFNINDDSNLIENDGASFMDNNDIFNDESFLWNID